MNKFDKPDTHLIRRAFAALSAFFFLGAIFFGGSRPALMASSNAETDLSVQITSSADEINVNSLLTYTIEVRNLGTETARGVKVFSSLNETAGFARVDASRAVCFIGGQSFQCELGELAPNAHAVITFQAIHTKGGTSISTARVVSDAIDPHTANNNRKIAVSVQE